MRDSDGPLREEPGWLVAAPFLHHTPSLTSLQSAGTELQHGCTVQPEYKEGYQLPDCCHQNEQKMIIESI